MKPSVNNLKTNQSTQLSATKRTGKKSANISWNSRFYFQIGLVVSLLAAFFILESSLLPASTNSVAMTFDGLEEPPMITYTVEKPKEIFAKVLKKELKKQHKIKQSPITKLIDVVPNIIPDTGTTITTPATSVNIPGETKIATAPTTNKVINLNAVEFVPVFPGCEALSSNKEKIACMSSKISAFIGRKFNTDIMSSSNSETSQKIYVQFRIDTQGNITQVEANANNKTLKKEAKRVVQKLPKMQPGKQGDRNVEVQYMIPITIRIE